MKNNKLSTIAIAALLVFALPMIAYSFPIAVAGTEGNPVIVSGNNDVIATYEGNSASYSNDLYLTMNNQFIFNNHTSPVGSSVNLGSFAIGTELIFRLYVNNTGYNFYTGEASRNPDNQFHARVQANYLPGMTLVSFEDLYNGPFDFNDLSFTFTNTSTSVPEPLTMFLLGIGLVGVAGMRRMRS